LYKDITHALNEIQPKLAETQRLTEKRDALRQRVTVLLKDAQESEIQSKEIQTMLANLQADSKSSVQHIFNELRETLVKAATKASSDKENNLRKTIRSLEDKNDILTKRIRSESLAWLPFKARDTMFYYPPFYNSWAEYWWKVQHISESYLPYPIHNAITNGEDIEDLIMTLDLTALEREDVILIKNYDINGKSEKVYVLKHCITWCNGKSWVTIEHQTLQQSTSEQIPITIGGTEYMIVDPDFKDITRGLDFLRSHMWSWLADLDDGV
jgi:hypothetical protein